MASVFVSHSTAGGQGGAVGQVSDPPFCAVEANELVALP